MCFAAGACHLRHHWPGVLLSDEIWSSMSLKRKAEQHSTFNQKGPMAKKRLIYPEETISILDEASSQKDMFAVDSSGDGKLLK